METPEKITKNSVRVIGDRNIVITDVDRSYIKIVHNTIEGNYGSKIAIAYSHLEKRVFEWCKMELDEVVANNAIPIIEKQRWKLIKHYPLNKSKEITFYDSFTNYFIENFRDETLSKFLLLGESGSGKSLNLRLHILNILKKNIEGDPIPIPVFIPLTSYKSSFNPNKTFEKWLILQINELYKGIGVKNIKILLDEHLIFPCLDGLDEVVGQQRDECAKAIDTYANEGHGMILSCRENEYDNLSYPLDGKFNEFRILPLSVKQIQTVLSSFEEKEEMISVINKNQAFADITKTPLTLNLFASVYKDLKENEVNELIEKTQKKEILNHLWKSYISISLAERKIAKEIKRSPVVITNWLMWLAGKMDENIFFIEQLQPSFLDEDLETFSYYISTRILNGILIVMAIGFFMASPLDYFSAGILGGWIVGVITYSLEKKRNNKHSNIKRKNASYLEGLGFFFAISIFVGFYQGLLTPRRESEMILGGFFATTEIYGGILLAIVLGGMTGLRRSWQHSQKDIQTVERSVLNIYQALKHGISVGLSLGVLVGTLALLIDHYLPYSAFNDWMDPTLVSWNMSSFTFGFLIGLMVGFMIGIALGWSDQEQLQYRKDEKKVRLKFYPNFGIIRSLKYASLAGLIFASIFILAYSFIFRDKIGEEFSVLIKVISNGIGGGLIVALGIGGLDVVQHFILRLIIFFKGKGPLKYEEFLSEAEALGFVKRSGARYSFIHFTLKEYLQSIPLTREIFKPPFKLSIIRSIFWSIILIISFPFVKALHNRYMSNNYWERQTEIIYDFADDSQNVIRLNNNQFKIDTSSHMKISASGYIKVGNFTGYAHAIGTEAAFMGFPLKDSYDSICEIRHAAVAFKIGKNGLFSPIQKHPDKDKFFYFPWDQIDTTINIQKGDTMYFLVNDKDYFNNLWHHKVKISLIDST